MLLQLIITCEVAWELISCLSPVESLTHCGYSVNMCVLISCWMASAGLINLTWGRKTRVAGYMALVSVWGCNMQSCCSASKSFCNMLGRVYSHEGTNSESVETWFACGIKQRFLVRMLSRSPFVPAVIRLACNCVIGDSERAREWEDERDPALSGSWGVHVDLMNLWFHVFPLVSQNVNGQVIHISFLGIYFPPYNLRVAWPY